VGLVVSVALLAWVVHDVDLAVVVAHLRRADPAALAAVVGLATLTFPLRTVRWRLMLRDAEGSPFPWSPLWHATAVGFMANNLLPFRAGEVARAYVASRALAVRFTTAFASVAIERVFDALILVALMAVALLDPSFPRGVVLDGASGIPIGRVVTGVAAAFGAVLLVAFLVARRPAPWLALADRLARRGLPERFAGRVAHALHGLVEGLAVLRQPARFAAVIGWSVVLWLINAASFALCFRAFGISLPAGAALLLQGVIAFGVAIPASPGFWGVFEAATRVTLALYGVDGTQAVSYAIAYHALTFVPITLLGLYSLSRVHVRLGELSAARAEGGAGERGGT